MGRCMTAYENIIFCYFLFFPETLIKVSGSKDMFSGTHSCIKNNFIILLAFYWGFWSNLPLRPRRYLWKTCLFLNLVVRRSVRYLFGQAEALTGLQLQGLTVTNSHHAQQFVCVSGTIYVPLNSHEDKRTAGKVLLEVDQEPLESTFKCQCVQR